MSSEEEMHMLPSFCEGIPSDMSPSEWCFGVISDVASGIITSFWRAGFKWRKGDTGCFLENGVHNGDRELSSGDWGSIGERGSLFGKQDYYEDVGVQLR